MPHLVPKEAVPKAGSRPTPAGESLTGDPDKAFQEADAVSEGHYGIPVITHCCLEPHGQTIAVNGEKVEYFPSTQNVYGIAGDIGRSLNIPIANVHTQMDYMGCGFRSKSPTHKRALPSSQLSNTTS